MIIANSLFGTAIWIILPSFASFDAVQYPVQALHPLRKVHTSVVFLFATPGV